MGAIVIKNRLCTGVAFAVAFAAGIAVPLHGAQAVTLVNNGSFETGSSNDGNSGFTTLSAGDLSITGWTIVSGTVDWIGSYWTPAGGSRSLDMNGLNPGKIGQALNGLVINQNYTVSFEMAGNPAGGPNPKTLSAGVGGDPSFSFDASNTSLSNMGWTLESFTFKATSSMETLWFASTTAGFSGNETYPTAFGPALDNVSVSATPLPSTWLMLLSGFVGLGFFAYRRKNRLSPVAA